MNMVKKIAPVFCIAVIVNLFTIITAWGQEAQQKFDRKIFYSAVASEDIDAIDNELAIIHANSIESKDAFEGVLLMKKADLVSNKKEKLNLFKSGKAKLEEVIIKDSTNAEFRFFRLQIQEHAPKFLKYHDELENDRQYIRKAFKNLPADVQQAILDYSKKSKILHSTDF
jgi:hypothetical protein